MVEDPGQLAAGGNVAFPAERFGQIESESGIQEILCLVIEDIPGQFIRYVSAILQKTVLNKRNPATVEIAGFFIGGEAGI